MKRNNSLMGTLLIGLPLALGAMQVQAVPSACSAYISDNSVTGSVSCLAGVKNDNNDSASDLNSGSYFSFNDWVEIFKDDGDSSSIFNVTPGGDGDWEDGTWSLGSWSGYTDLVIVLKDGGVPEGWLDSDKFYWFAYLLDNVTKPTSGTWAYGDGKYDFAGDRDLSHATLYGRRGGTTTNVPEPASLALFSLGLLGVGFAARRRKV